MQCNSFKMAKQFYMPLSMKSRIVDHNNPFPLDYILGLADALYEKYSDDTVAVYLKQSFINLCHGMPLELCITDSATMQHRRELLSNEYVMKAMENRMTQFDLKFVDFLSEEKYKENYNTLNKFVGMLGFISNFPKIYEQTIERNYFNDEIERIRTISEPIFAPKQREKMTLKLISRRKARDAVYYIVNALYDDKHLITYFDSKNDIKNIKIGEKFNIRATVSKHTFSDFNQCNETRLSRVVYR